MTRKRIINYEPQGKTSGQRELLLVSDEQLEKILESHKKWVETKGKYGRRAILNNVNLQFATLIKANLQKADLEEANLQGAFLVEANLQGANLRNANLQEALIISAKLQGADFFEANLKGANLDSANLQGAQLSGTVLQEAILQDADLSNVKGLMGGQVAGTNVTGARLPSDIIKFEGLIQVGEAAKNARKLFFLMLLGCVYSGLTIATTTDAWLLTNSASSPLPIIGTEIPIVGFFLMAPIILLSVYLYSHIYLQRLWEGLAKLPARFPDGRVLHERAYPWLLTGLVCAHFKLLKPNRPALSKIQVFLSIILAWWIIPITLLLFWARYLPRHEPGGTALHVIMAVISIAAAIFLYRLAVSTLRGDKRKPFLWNFKDSRIYRRSAVTLGIVAIGIGFYLFSIAAISSNRKSEVSEVLRLIGIRAHSDFYEADVSEKPTNWTGMGKEAELALVKGARLKGRDLRYVNAELAFLIKADLRGAKLAGANLQGAKLAGANLGDANLALANLQGANLQGANLIDANLQDADLQWANLQGADLGLAFFNRANLNGADLRGAKNLSPPQIKEATNWFQAYYDNGLLTRLGLPLNHNERISANNFSEYDFSRANLQGANFKGADLQGANLQGANLENAELILAKLVRANLQEANLGDANLALANLVGASFHEAIFMRTDFRRAKNLSPSEIKEAINWFQAYYDNGLLTRLGLPLNHNERISARNFSEYNLSGANLQGADFKGANLQGANLQEAKLQSADLQGANLQGAKSLSVEQLSKVKTLYKAKLDPELMEQVKKKHPHLLKKPRPEEKEKDN